MASVTVDPLAAIAILEEAARLARDEGFSSALAIVLPFLAWMLPLEESRRALALLDEAVGIGEQVGDRLGVLAATGIKGTIAARRGEWRIALHAAVETAEQQLQLGDLPNIHQSFLFAGLAFCEFGNVDAAATLIGKGDAISDRKNMQDWTLEMLATSDAVLVETLGAERVAILAARGAALDATEAVAYLRAQAAPLLETE